MEEDYIEKADKSMTAKQSSDSVIALFSGAGGMSLGFSQAGLCPAVAADLDEDACATYRANIHDGIFNIDLAEQSEVLARAIDSHANVFAIIGGPPCQGFSSAGVKNGQDKRNKLIFNYLALVERVRPRWFLFENVEGLLTSHGGQSVVDLVREFIRIGYRVRLEKVNFASYGLPQARKRVILVGNRLGLDFELPPETFSFNAGKHKGGSKLPPAPTIDEALSGLGQARSDSDERSSYTSDEPTNTYDAAMRLGNNFGSVTLHYASVPPRMSALLAQLRPGQTMKDLPLELRHSSFKRRANRRVMDGTPTEKRGGAPSGVKRLVGDLNALTITSAATREFIHPRSNRPLTLREAARLQAFPDKYEFVGGASSIARQIGNAFPPLAAWNIAKHLAGLDGAFGADHASNRHPNGALIDYRLTEASGMSPALATTDTLLRILLNEQSAFDFETVPRCKVA